MPESNLNSFVSANQYTKENLTFPFLAGMVLGTGYVAPSFSGTNGAANNDPGGLFGWLVYSRSSRYATPKGSTTDKYIRYNDPYELVLDLNQLNGITSCLISATGQGGTFGFFEQPTNTAITPRTAGMQFLHALNYLAYGGSLVIAPNTSGLSDYSIQNNQTYDVVLDPNYGNSIPSWLITQPYTIGIFPTIPGSDGVTGSGLTLANYASLLGSSSLVTGLTVANRIFNVCGVKQISDLDTTSLQSGTKLTYSISAIHDVAGFFARAKSRNETYLTVAGLDRSIPINGSVTNAIDWASTLRTTLRNNKANFFVNVNSETSGTQKFLGSDLVGATASTTISVNDRVGPARLRTSLTKDLSDTMLRYIFDINNANTRNQVVSAVQTTLDPYAPFLDTTQTQIICSNAHNQDNSSSLALDVIVKPILSTESFSINLVYTQ